MTLIEMRVRDQKETIDEKERGETPREAGWPAQSTPLHFAPSTALG